MLFQKIEKKGHSHQLLPKMKLFDQYLKNRRLDSLQQTLEEHRKRIICPFSIESVNFIKIFSSNKI